MVPAAALPQLSRVTLGKQLPSFSCKASVNLNKAPRRRQNPAFVTKETGFLSMLIKLEPCFAQRAAASRQKAFAQCGVNYYSSTDHLLRDLT